VFLPLVLLGLPIGSGVGTHGTNDAGSALLALDALLALGTGIVSSSSSFFFFFLFLLLAQG
jgi:hypothetical protein